VLCPEDWVKETQGRLLPVTSRLAEDMEPKQRTRATLGEAADPHKRETPDFTVRKRGRP
jgi:hypothetical protein